MSESAAIEQSTHTHSSSMAAHLRENDTLSERSKVWLANDKVDGEAHKHDGNEGHEHSLYKRESERGVTREREVGRGEQRQRSGGLAGRDR